MRLTLNLAPRTALLPRVNQSAPTRIIGPAATFSSPRHLDPLNLINAALLILFLSLNTVPARAASHEGARSTTDAATRASIYDEHVKRTFAVVANAPAPPTLTNTSPGSTSSPGPTMPGSSVTLSWSLSSGATTYGVGVRDLTTNALVVDTDVSGTSFTANLTPGRPYRWNVNACNSTGCSGYTTPLYFQTPGSLSVPATPGNTNPGSTSSPGPTLSGSTVTLSWSASSGATSYGVGVRDLITNALVVDTDVGGTSYTANLSDGRPYRWNVNACNNAGCSSYTTPLYFQTPGGVTVPPTPGNTSPGSTNSPGPIASSSIVTLSWSPSSGANSYGVGVRDLTTNALVVDTDVSGTSYTAHLSEGRQYRWNVNACNSAGCSSYTTPLYFQTPGGVSVPPTPTNTSPGSTSSPGPTMPSSSVILSWSPSSGATSYGLGVRDLTTNILVVDTDVSGTSYTANLSPGKPYRWNVNACNGAGCSSYTTPLYFQTPGGGVGPGPFTLSNEAPVCDTNPPVAPAVRLNWTQSSGADSYDLYRNGSLYWPGLTGTTFYNNDNVAAGQNYTYFVRARNSSGTTDSPQISVTIPGDICGGGQDAEILISETYPDGTRVNAGQAFTKTWRLQNTGTTTWNNYSVVFNPSPGNGNPSINMSSGGQSSFPIGFASPGQQIDISIPMVAPASPGTYYSYWRLKNSSGGLFGSFYVKIVVPTTTTDQSPIISSIEPAAVMINQFTTLSVKGSNFQSGFSADVIVSGVSYPIANDGLTFVSSGLVKVAVKMGGTPPYTATLRVTNPDLKSASRSFSVSDSVDTTAPVASFNFTPPAPAVNQSVQFTDSSSGPSLSWDWDFEGDGVVDTHARNPIYTFKSPGPHQVTLTVRNSYGSDSLSKTVSVGGDVGMPTITNVTRTYYGFFLKGGGLSNTFTVNVNWNGSPGKISYSVNGGTPVVKGCASGCTTHTFSLDNDFPARLAASSVTITPTNAAGVAGTPWVGYVTVLPFPNWLTVVLGKDPTALKFTAGAGEIKANLRFDFPDPHLASGGPINIPSWVPFIGGKFGLDETYARVTGSFSSKGSGSLSLGGQIGFNAMGQKISGSAYGSGNFLLNERGLNLTGASINLSLTGTLSKEMTIIEAIPPLSFLEHIPGVKNFSRRAKLIGEVTPSLGFSANWAQNSAGSLAFSNTSGKIGLKLKGTLKIEPFDRLEARGWVSGEGVVNLQVPPNSFLRSLDLNFEAGVQLRVDTFLGSASYTKTAAYGCTWAFGGSPDCHKKDTASASATPLLFADASTDAVVIGQNLGGVALSPIRTDYTRFGEYSAFNPLPLDMALSSGVPVSVSETSLITNVFPGASPALVEVGGGQLLLWERQDPALPVLQSTDISWSFNNGGGWSLPALIRDDKQAELSPVAGKDINGNVVAAWLRIKDPEFTAPVNKFEDLPVFYNRLEVVSSVFNPATRSWSPIIQLTDDAALDTNLRMSTDGAGRLLLTWLSNPSGTFTSDAAHPSTLKFSFWNGVKWDVPRAVATGLDGVNTHAPAVKGTKAFIILPRDPNPDVDGDGVLNLYKWNGSSWIAGGSFASGGVENRLPSALYDATGVGHVIWLRDDNLVHATLTNPAPVVVRRGSSSMAFYNSKFFTNQQGNSTLVWQEVVDNGPANIFAMLYDPASRTWSADRRLNEDPWLSHDVSGYYGNDGQIHLAYLATEILRTSRTVTIGDVPKVINNIPRDGRTDLRLLEHSLVVDLSVTNRDLRLTPQLPQGGEAVTATLDIHNAGDFAIGSFVVKLYAGNPAVSGTLVGSQVVAGPLRAGDHRIVTFNFRYPAPGRNVVAVIDANDDIAEVTEANNTATIYFNNSAPVVRVVASATRGIAPLSVSFNASATTDPDGDAVSFIWAFADGTENSTGAVVGHTFSKVGRYPVTLAVTDARGAVGTVVVIINVTNPMSISGRVLGGGGVGVPNVKLVLRDSQVASNTPPATALTNLSGDYKFTNLPAGSNYTLTPEKSGYSFKNTSSPSLSFRSYTNLSADLSNQNFTAVPLPTLSVSNVTITEIASGTSSAVFSVKLSASSAQAVTVKYATANGTAVAPMDYTAIPLTTLSFAPGQTTKTVAVTVKGDLLDEAAETFRLLLSSPVNANLAVSQATCTITDTDAPPAITISNASVTEPDSGTVNATFTVKLSAASGKTTSVKYATANGTAAAGSDYTALALTTLTFSPGQTTKTVIVPVRGDALKEPNETFVINLSGATNATIADAQGLGTIINDD